MLNMITGMPMGEEIQKRELTDIELREVSLVDKPASRRKFIFFKSSDDGACIDLLDTIEAIEENYTLSAEESGYIEKTLRTLNVLDSEDVEALSNVILLLSKLVESEDVQVSKACDLKWPSFRPQHSTVQKTEASDDALWPSLC